MAFMGILRSVRRRAPLILALFLVALLAIFLVQNAEVIQLNFLFWSFTARRSLLVILLLVIGAGLGLLLRGYFHLRGNRSVRDAARRAADEKQGGKAKEGP